MNVTKPLTIKTRAGAQLMVIVGTAMNTILLWLQGLQLFPQMN
ncbi:MAG: hypothetical protein ACI97A_001425 [Planctomycetota bacterium]|jgi:hypothetical protein